MYTSYLFETSESFVFLQHLSLIRASFDNFIMPCEKLAPWNMLSAVALCQLYSLCC